MRWTISCLIGIAGLFVILGPAAGADWNEIRPQVTGEPEILSKFGSPDEIVVTFPWQEWSAKWKKRPRASYYTFRYQHESPSSLLTGPGGQADSAEVEIGDGKVMIVRWLYGGPSARAAAARIRADTTMKPSGSEGTVQYLAKEVTGGWVSVEIGPRDAEVKVTLQLK